MSFKKFNRGFFISIASMAAIVAYLVVNRYNFHRVESHGQEKPKVYRSAQLHPRVLEHLIEEKDIDVIMNLRGESRKPWYKKEKKLCKKHGVEYYTYGFSIFRPPDRERFLNILQVLDDVKANNKTLMIHCRAGSDRTGLISTIIQIYLFGYGIDEALADSFQWFYGHFPDKDGVLEQVIENYRPYAAEMNFREWVETKYDRPAILAYAEAHK